jgi:hypothetical protein
MRRAALFAVVLLSGLSLATTAARAAAPGLGTVSATDVQGVSAVLRGTVDAEGLATTYHFEYGTQASFAGAAKTQTSPVGSASGSHPARAAIAGLLPNTTYYYRLVATNSSGTSTGTTGAGTAANFTTTAGFGFKGSTAGFAVSALADGGAPASTAGSHPYQLSFHVGFNEAGEAEGQPGDSFPDGDVRELGIEMPAGMFLNPSILPVCDVSAFSTPRNSPFEVSRSGENCPATTQIGTVEVSTSRDGGQGRRFGVFNVDSPKGAAARLGFAPYGSPIVMDVFLRPQPDGRYKAFLEAEDIPQSLDLKGIDMVLWGAPWGVSHNGERGNCLNEAESDFPWAKCSVGNPGIFVPKAFVTLPVECSSTLAFNTWATSWQQPAKVETQALNRDALNQPVAVNTCSSVAFAPQTSAFLTVKRASAASGFNFRLTHEDSGIVEPLKRAAAPPRQITLAFPPGVTVNPSVGAGLGVCAPEQYAAETGSSIQGQACPNAAKIGEFSARTRLFEGERLEGAVYLAQPDDPTTQAAGAENPFDSLLALYLVTRLPKRGLIVKAAGRLIADHANGNLTAVFEKLPELPYANFELNLRPGQRAFLISPPQCGGAVTQISLLPWVSSVAGVNASNSSEINTGFDEGACPSGTPPFGPTAVTGGVNAHVGAYTPYFVRLSRQDNEQEITSYSLVLPKGITGKLAGIPFCPDAAIDAARHKRGFAEIANPSCPAASQVGHTDTGYGVGNALAYSPGKVYLAGPYNGKALSLVTINAATIGPFDLGTYVIRSAFAVDPRTAQLRIDAGSSDPIPHISDGIPLHLRDIRIHMDRFQFTKNPSSCAPSELLSTLTGSGVNYEDQADDSSATVSRHFQLFNCLTLGFQPKLGLRLRGGSKRGDHPSLRATFAARGAEDSNLRRIEVTTPHALFLAQEHIREICTRPQFEAERCPHGSEYGKAVAYTPLFDEPLRGPVYLRSSSNKLPDLVASLRAGSIRIILEGKIGPSKQGGISTFFDELPDAPIERFTMTLYGGKRGLLINSTNICRRPPVASIKALAQNNIGAIFTSKLRGQCTAKKGKGKPSQKRKARR